MTEPIHDISVEGFIESFNRRYPTFILKTLLCDRTTGRNIIWADNEYETLGDGYMGDDEITVEKITGMNSGVVKPRIAKEQEKQSKRTKSRAEVFTPSWLCNEMNNDLDETWFGRRDVFNTEVIADYGASTWTTANDPIEFPKSKGHGWHAYVEAPRLEITCGEAPFVCSRYDTVTGDELPVCNRVGFLDRKLRVVTEKTKTRKEWVRRALDALRATYGFEYQGDNLLIARINVLETFVEYLRDRWGSDAKQDELEQAALIISWNLWQMNGFTDAVPTNKMGAEVESSLETFEKSKPELIQPFLFDRFDYEATEETREEGPKEMVPLCVIYDWQNDEPFEFVSLKGKTAVMGKKFYAVIGNPPYQEQASDNNTRMPPIYNYFMDESYKVSPKVELITPARFLFNAGQTPKAWNRKMLNDPHFKVLYYEQDSSLVFADTDIKGGVVVSYRDEEKEYEAIRIFTPYDELNDIVQKVLRGQEDGLFLDSIISSRGMYRLTDCFFADHPDIQPEKGTGNMITSNAFDSMPGIFKADSSEPDCVRLYGRENQERVFRYISRKYIIDNDYLPTYNVLVPEGNGSGALGEILSTPVIAPPGTGHTDTFISIGSFECDTLAQNCLTYIKSKFARTMLGVLKITQHNPASTWKYVPLQDFDSSSDIDWSQPVADIDRQLYAKYGLDDEEIEFIESHVKEMN